MLILRCVRVDILVLLVVANSTPVLLSMLLAERWATAIDAGRVLTDGRPVLGPHKTWRGLLGGTLATGAIGALWPVGFVTGAAVGFCALLGDLVSSCIKRRAGLSSGADSLLLDQLPEGLVPMLILYQPLGLDLVSLPGTLAVFVLLALGAAKLFTYRRTPGAAP